VLSKDWVLVGEMLAEKVWLGGEKIKALAGAVLFLHNIYQTLTFQLKH
jgi:hypothetical protein